MSLRTQGGQTGQQEYTYFSVGSEEDVDNKVHIGECSFICNRYFNRQQEMPTPVLPQHET